MTSNKPSTKPPKSSVAPSLSDDGTPPWLPNLVSPTPDHHRDIPTGCSDPSAGAVFLTKLIRLDTTRAFRALCDDPAVSIEVGSLILPPVVGVVAGTVLFWRQRARWSARDFSNRVHVGLYSFRASKVEGRPMMTVRTLSEYRVENLVTNDHGRLEIKSAAKKHLVGKEYMGLIHMEPPAARLWSRVLINAVSEQFAAGALQRDLGVANVKCARYGLGLVSSIGYEGGTKMRAMLISESLLKQAVGLAEEGRQPVYEVPGHHVAWPLVLRVAEALHVKSSAGATLPDVLAKSTTSSGIAVRLPPGTAEGDPVAAWVELCGAAGGAS